MIPERFAAQLLTGRRTRDPLTVVERLLAVQGQDPRGFRLALRARTTGLSAVDVDRALTVDRSLVVAWLNRGTLHLVRSEDYRWLHPLTTPRLEASILRRLQQFGVPSATAERGVAVVERALGKDGALTGPQVRERLRATGIGEGALHVLGLTAVRGLVVRGPLIGRQHAYVLVRDWLGAGPAVDRDSALAELARRYLAGHAPASAQDLAKWAGITLGQARAAFRSIGGELRERPDGLVQLNTRLATTVPPPRLLGPFDPLLHGWVSREPVLGRHAPAIVTGGVFRPFALVEGRAAAGWAWRAGEVHLMPFGRLSGSERAALDAEAADVRRFFGDPGRSRP